MVLKRMCCVFLNTWDGSSNVPNILFMEDLLLRAVSREVVDVVGTGHTLGDMMLRGVVVVSDGLVVVVDTVDGEVVVK